jgi:hypothetical protein
LTIAKSSTTAASTVMLLFRDLFSPVTSGKRLLSRSTQSWLSPLGYAGVKNQVGQLLKNLA